MCLKKVIVKMAEAPSSWSKFQGGIGNPTIWQSETIQHNPFYIICMYIDKKYSEMHQIIYVSTGLDVGYGQKPFALTVEHSVRIKNHGSRWKDSSKNNEMTNLSQSNQN